MKKIDFNIFLFLMLFNINLILSWSTIDNKNENNKIDHHIKGMIGNVEIEDITINGLEEKIPFYNVPEKDFDDPRSSVAYLSLIPSYTTTYIKKIRIEKNIYSGKDNLNNYEVKYSKKNWISLIITFSTGTSRQFLVEPNATIFAKDSKLGISYKYELKGLSEKELFIFPPENTKK